MTAIETGHGQADEQPPDEILKPWEFVLYPSQFDDLCDYYKRGMRRSELSVLDPRTGNDFWAVKRKKGIRLDKQESAPIFVEDENFEAYLQKVYDQISMPNIRLSTEKDLIVFARKCKADAYGDGEDEEGGENGSRRGKMRSYSPRDRADIDEDEDEDGDEGEDNGAAARAVGRRSLRTAPVVDEETDQPAPPAPRQTARVAVAVAARPGAPKPAAPLAAAVAAPRPVTSQKAVARPAQQEESAPPVDDDDQIPGAEVPAKPKPIVRSAPVATPSRPAAAPARNPVVRQAPKPAAAPVRESVEEEDSVADESTDQAGPAEVPLPDEAQPGDEQGDQPAEEAQAQPPAPKPAAARVASRMDPAMVNRIRSLAAQGQ